jgi:sortase A
MMWTNGWDVDGSYGLRQCAHFCFVAGAMVLALCAYIWTDSHVYQALQSRHFDQTAAAVVDRHVAVRSNLPPSLGSAVGRIEIPRLGLSVVIFEGDDVRTLRRGAGHIPGTAWPGQAGNMAIAGHRDSFFRLLRDIREDDIIRLTTVDESYVYRVESFTVVGPRDIQVLDKTIHPALTLITCFPFSYVGPAPERFIVRASQVSTPARDATMPR